MASVAKFLSALRLLRVLGILRGEIFFCSGDLLKGLFELGDVGLHGDFFGEVGGCGGALPPEYGVAELDDGLGECVDLPGVGDDAAGGGFVGVFDLARRGLARGGDGVGVGGAEYPLGGAVVQGADGGGSGEEGFEDDFARRVVEGREDGDVGGSVEGVDALSEPEEANAIADGGALGLMEEGVALRGDDEEAQGGAGGMGGGDFCRGEERLEAF